MIPLVIFLLKSCHFGVGDPAGLPNLNNVYASQCLSQAGLEWNGPRLHVSVELWTGRACNGPGRAGPGRHSN